MKNFKFFLMLAFTILIFNVSFGSAIPDDNKDISQVVDVDVGVEAVAVATLEFTSTIFVSNNRQKAIGIDNKLNFLEISNDKRIWKFENIPLTNNIKTSSKTNTKILNSTSGGMAGTRGLGQIL